MSTFIYKWFLLAGAIILGGLLGQAPVAQAGGWAVVTLDELPAQVVVNQPVSIGFMVRQHGRHPTPGLSPQITLTHLESQPSLTIAATEQGGIGHYVASLKLPQAGQWAWTIQGFGMAQPMPALTVLAATPAMKAASSAQQSRPALELSASLPLMAGGVALVGVMATWLAWLRFRRRWTVSLGALAVAISLAGFGLVASQYGWTKAPAQANPTIATPAVAAVAATPAELGQALFVAKGCIVCHQHQAETIKEIRRDFGEFGVGPKLPSPFVLTASLEALQQWLRQPEAIKPDTDMPNLKLKDDEIEALVAFLRQK
jgi:cytochrome c2